MSQCGENGSRTHAAKSLATPTSGGCANGLQSGDPHFKALKKMPCDFGI